MRIKNICVALICALGITISGCTSQEGKAVAKEETMSQNCTVSFRLEKVNLGQRNRANLMPSPFSMWQVAQSPDDFSGPADTYITAVTEEAENLAKSTFCELAKGDNVLVDLTFISASYLGPTEAELLRLPRHGFAGFDSDTGVLRAVFVRSTAQMIEDIYALKTGDDSELRGVPHSEPYQQINAYLKDQKESIPAGIQWLFESASHISDEDEKRDAIFAKIETMKKHNVDEAYIAAASTFLKNAIPNTGFLGGYGFNNLVGPEIAKTYKSQE